MEGMQLNMGMEPVLQEQGTENTNLYDVVQCYDRDFFKLPLHQRGKVWKPQKKKRWVWRIKNQTLKPVGTILTYQLTGGSPIYLNDGQQRTQTSLEYWKRPELYGDTLEVAEAVLRACRYPRQHRWYETHDEALVDFQLVNLGSYLTPFEFCKGILVYMLDYTAVWEEMLGKLRKGLVAAAPRIVRSRLRIKAGTGAQAI